jgi:hypothetical protein
MRLESSDDSDELLPDPEHMSLGDPAIVDMLVREFLGAVVDIRIAYNAGEEAAPVARLRQTSIRFARIFYGEDKRYQPLKPWNSSEQLGVEIEQRLSLAHGDGNAAEHLFITLASDAVAVLAAHEQGTISEEVARFRLDVLIEESHALLIGWPPPEAD